jgi:iron complex outermembrane recepter protein
MRNLLFTLCIMLLFCQTAFAGELKGRVIDSTGQPLADVLISSDISDITTKTNQLGEYVLQVDDNIYHLKFSLSGYQTREIRMSELPSIITLERLIYRGEDVVVRTNRVERGLSTIAFDNISEDEIARDYTVSEIPLLLETTPNLYSYSDAGSAQGYSYMKIRGFDDKRIVTYINGVPLNDPEDQATYFVDLPDFASTVTDIQIQRGVGNSLYGDASFGGSINILSNGFSREKKTELSMGYGEYTSDGNSVASFSRQTVDYSSGLIDGRWVFSGRYSKMKSDGYRHNSWYDGWAYYLSVARLDPSMSTEMILYGGPMNMHLSYYGTSRDDLENDRRTNYLTYANETDNFNQPHYQFHNVYKLNDNAVLSNTIYYISGKGYYEQYKSDRDYFEYNIDPSLTDSVDGGDLVRQQWVKKNQLGWNPRLDFEHNRGRHTLGGSFYYFDSDHWGQVVWAQNITGHLNPRHKYYQYYGTKNVGSIYGQEFYKLTDKLSSQITAQIRYQKYSFDQEKMGAFSGYNYDLDYLFFSPRLGLNYSINDQISVYTNFAVASRTPTDAAIYDANDPFIMPSLEIEGIQVTSPGDTLYNFGDPTAKSERVYNFELGGEYRLNNYKAGINLFWMDFQDEILPYGGINENTGLPITINADRSVHAGVEMSFSAVPTSILSVNGNFSYNYNRVKDYDLALSYDVDSGGTSFTETATFDMADKKITGFPEYLGNLIVDYKQDWWRLTYKGRFVGSQYMELFNIDDWKIDSYFISSLSASATWNNFLKVGNLTFSVKVDNLFDKKYESAGYGGNYAWRMAGESTINFGGWAEYFVGAERSIYSMLKLEIF